MDTATGVIDARFRLALPDNDAPRPTGPSYTGQMVSAYGVSADGRFTWTRDDGGHIGGLYDREERRAWTWPPGGVQLRGASARYFVFEEVEGAPPGDPTGRYIVVDREMQEVSRFALAAGFYTPTPAFDAPGTTAVLWSAPRDDRTRHALPRGPHRWRARDLRRATGDRGHRDQLL